MAKGPSKARESRVNIVIADKLKGGAEPELPFRIMVMGDYTMKQDNTPVYDRQLKDINKSNFDSVMQSYNLSLDVSVDNKISGKGEIGASLKFGTLKDFRPEAIARQIPETKKLMELREAFKALRPKLGDKAAQQKFMSTLKKQVADPKTREDIMKKIAGDAGGGDAPAADAPAEGGGEAPPAAE
jgi:type VI secretion system protein ImpB